MMPWMSSAGAATKLPTEQKQPEDDHRLAPEAVGRRAVGDLQEGLRQAVGADRQPDQRHIVAPGQLLGVHREDRQDQEQAEHAQGEDRGQPDPGAAFGRSQSSEWEKACSGRNGNRGA
jgi:hypothetical protein